MATAQPIIHISQGIGMHISPGTAINLDGLVLAPTHAFVLTAGVNKNSIVSNTTMVPYIQQVYTMDNTINNFSGTLSILYGNTVMNNIDEKNLGLYINNGSSWDFYNNNPSLDLNKKIYTSQLINTSLNEVTLAESLIILPLQLLSFTGLFANGNVQLQWQTTAEKNTAYFEIERSKDGKFFTSIAQVKALNSSGNHQYYLTDNTALSAIIYYRIKIFDIDGKSIDSKIIQLKNSTAEKINVYPNPFLKEITLSVNQPTTITVWTPDGKILFTKNLFVGNNVLSMENLAAGVYIIQDKNGNTARVIKQF